VLHVEDRRAEPPATTRLHGLGGLLRFAWRAAGLARQPLALTAPLARGLTAPGPRASFHHAGRNLTPEQLAAAYLPQDGGGRILLLVPPPGRSPRVWEAGRDVTGATYAERLERLLGWVPVHVRVSDGDPVAAAVALGSLVQRYVDALPATAHGGPARIVLLGYGAGGLLARNALGVATTGTPPWTRLVTDLIALGTPPYAVTSAPLSRGVGRAIDEQLAGIAVAPAEVIAVPPAEGVEYVLVTDTALARVNPVSRLLGELLWWRHKSPLRRRKVHELFPTAERFELPTAAAPLSNHPEVHDALLRWLA